MDDSLLVCDIAGCRRQLAAAARKVGAFDNMLIAWWVVTESRLSGCFVKSSFGMSDWKQKLWSRGHDIELSN